MNLKEDCIIDMKKKNKKIVVNYVAVKTWKPCPQIQNRREIKNILVKTNKRGVSVLNEDIDITEIWEYDLSVSGHLLKIAHRFRSHALY